MAKSIKELDGNYIAELEAKVVQLKARIKVLNTEILVRKNQRGQQIRIAVRLQKLERRIEHTVEALQSELAWIRQFLPSLNPIHPFADEPTE